MVSTIAKACEILVLAIVDIGHQQLESIGTGRSLREASCRDFPPLRIVTLEEYLNKVFG